MKVIKTNCKAVHFVNPNLCCNAGMQTKVCMTLHLKIGINKPCQKGRNFCIFRVYPNENQSLPVLQLLSG